MENKILETFGLTADSTRDELKQSYLNLRKGYESKRFMSGSEGEEACAKIDELDAKYKEADEFLRQNYYSSNAETVYAEIAKMVETGNLDGAQAELDDIYKHNGEWYYHQAMVFYRRSWLNEARDQLKAAVELDPTNAKYKESLAKMTAKMAQHQAQAEPTRSYNGNPNGRSYSPNQQPQAVGCSPCTVCNTLLCADCCCECMGGDCIACC